MARMGTNARASANALTYRHLPALALTRKPFALPSRPESYAKGRICTALRVADQNVVPKLNCSVSPMSPGLERIGRPRLITIGPTGACQCSRSEEHSSELQ